MSEQLQVQLAIEDEALGVDDEEGSPDAAKVHGDREEDADESRNGIVDRTEQQQQLLLLLALMVMGMVVVVVVVMVVVVVIELQQNCPAEHRKVEEVGQT